MAETEGSTWPALIPEFYYDLISRIPSGTLLLILLMYELIGEKGRQVALDLMRRGELEGIPFAGLFILLISGGYALGILISPLGHLIRRLYLSAVWKDLIKKQPELFSAVCQAYDIAVPASDLQTPHPKSFTTLKARDFLKIYRLMHDHLKALDPQPRVLLPKMSAEAALCENLIAVVVVWLSFLGLRQSATLSAEVLAGGILSAFLALLAGFHRYRQSIARHFSFFRLQQGGVFKHAA